MIKVTLLVCAAIQLVACGSRPEQADIIETPVDREAIDWTAGPQIEPTPFQSEPITSSGSEGPAGFTAVATAASSRAKLVGVIDVMPLAFQATDAPVEDVVIYTEETDPDSLLGRPDQYIAKMSWRDTRVARSGEPGIDTGGTIEVFLDRQTLEARKSYIEEVTAGNAMLAGYMFDNGSALMRLTSRLTPKQAQGYNDVFQAVSSR